MHTIRARNVNHALSEGLWYLTACGLKENSRNGEVIVAPEPVCTVYQRPQERVLFNRARNANPFFHLMEALWMLAGHNDVAWPAQFNRRFTEYSDDGVIVNGGYGYRWRTAFGFDQIDATIKLLREEPETRRAVIGMWSPSRDLGEASKDIPCNTQIYFDLRGGALNMTVTCRSNDIMWGAYGANAVHFSVLQEFIAAAVGVPVGVYRQVSNNYHLYTAHYNLDNHALRLVDDLYSSGRVELITPFPLVWTDAGTWMEDLRLFMRDPESTKFVDVFFTAVASPMYAAWMGRKAGCGNGADIAQQIDAADWRVACLDWIKIADERRTTK